MVSTSISIWGFITASTSHSLQHKIRSFVATGEDQLSCQQERVGTILDKVREEGSKAEEGIGSSYFIE